MVLFNKVPPLQSQWTWVVEIGVPTIAICNQSSPSWRPLRLSSKWDNVLNVVVRPGSDRGYRVRMVKDDHYYCTRSSWS
jgi:hypothetical protein